MTIKTGWQLALARVAAVLLVLLWAGTAIASASTTTPSELATSAQIQPIAQQPPPGMDDNPGPQDNPGPGFGPGHHAPAVAVVVDPPGNPDCHRCAGP